MCEQNDCKSKKLSKDEFDELMNKFSGMSAKESAEYQLINWLNGISLHNPIVDECCPDFSCCNGGNMIAFEVRKRFFDAYQREDVAEQWEILGMCLSMLVSEMDVDVHVAGNSTTIH